MNTLPTPNPLPPWRIAPSRRVVPPLENGAKLGAKEFMRRYEAMPHVKKAELIEGIVYVMTSPVRYTCHSKPDATLTWLLGMYRCMTPGVGPGVNGTVKLDDENTFQPDGMLLYAANRGGKTHIDEEDYVVGPPELIVEIAVSSVSLDMHRKLKVYLLHGVPEYICWCTEDPNIYWWYLKDGEYQLIPLDPDGIMRSRIFPGLRLDPKAMLADDCARMKAVMELGLQSPEHTAFVGAI